MYIIICTHLFIMTGAHNDVDQNSYAFSLWAPDNDINP